jgi:hypothetical protein
VSSVEDTFKKGKQTPAARQQQLRGRNLLLGWLVAIATIMLALSVYLVRGIL